MSWWSPMLAKATELEDLPPGKLWLAQPKLDGCRALWDGERIWSRSGKPTIRLHPDTQAELLKHFLGVPLDGELYNHGDDFETNVSAARTGKRLAYCVFDMPVTGVGFQDRWSALKVLFGGCEWGLVHPVATEQITTEEATDGLRKFVGHGYEGIILRDPSAYYAFNRTSALLKIKPVRMMQGVVVGVEPGLGKHVDRIGALWVEGVAGATWSCKVGTGMSNADRERGGVWWLNREITVGFQELTRYGVPRFPRLVKIGEQAR